MIAVAHRARQFLDALHVREDGSEARPFLTPAQWSLLAQQVPRDRKHALACWRALAGAGGRWRERMNRSGWPPSCTTRVRVMCGCVSGCCMFC